ncbi:non-hydrolyzing UDP-N-acetylglucosamine 2-epimerase [Draconibacterium sediminis]|uniref:UDP-N-acetylglucosamine 2-epimerase (non-hydrolyzing) n=1 Tax=Draconibacterium sediminis TaxID=1544798 RepID=A0A0D8JF18_9BACT|nr:UDP-N-acetylglucosamine 2-epimerase (non-hydrolyzing) [Draconibacterium sediminis]KJF44438.1 UDP-N-acetylglucosamine 2-epimerase [Draconibacterium sediminis]
MKKKILSVFGTRPEAIKMAPLVKELEKNKDIIDCKVCVTAQHREMLDQVLEIFDIQPDYDLDIMKSNQDLYEITSRVLLKMRDVLDDYQPDVVLVHGDTTTSTTAALAAFYKQIAVGHIEAGLRTGNIYSPWPEEMNRKMTGALSTWHFAPTQLAQENLLRENINKANIFITGNTVIDALFLATEKIKTSPKLEQKIMNELNELFQPDLESVVNSRFILVTGHRRENFGDGFIQICESLQEIAREFPDVNIVYPVHLNPNVKGPVYELLNGFNNIHLIQPLSYLPFIYLLEKCYFVLTDSGGIQEEAPSFGKPVLVMRDTTERPEAVNAGTVKLVGTNKDKILTETRRLINEQSYYNSMAEAHNPYGDGKACERIVKQLIEI